MFAVLHFPQFTLQAVLRHEPELWAKPLALVDPALTTPRICEMTPPAHALGVTDGFTPTQALARCRELIIRHRSPSQEAAATEAILQCAFGFSPNIENTSPGIVTLDLRGLSELLERRREGADQNTEKASASLRRRLQAWASRLRDALSSLNLTARIGIGPTPNVARHAAWWAAVSMLQRFNASTPLSDGIQIVLDSLGFIASLPVAALEPSNDVASILHKWGIRTVGELLALGQDAVVDRLGLEALALFAAASPLAIRPLNLVRPAEHFEEAFDFAHEVETMEPLLFILRRFVDYLAQRLELAGLAAELLTLRLRLESGEVVERRLRVPQPTSRGDILFRMLQTHLERLRTASPIIRVALKADPTQPEQKQFSLFEAALRDPHQFQETLARLSALVGAARVGTPLRENSHQPDAFKLVPPDFENTPGGIVERVAEILRAAPMRRLRPAMKTQVECSKLSVQSSKENPGAKFQKADGGPAHRANNIVELLGPLFSAPTARQEMERPSSARPMVRNDRAEQDLGTPIDGALQPFSIRCKIAKGRLTVALGPWRASGRWWDPGAWQRQEWDVATPNGEALRLVHQAEGWLVEGLVD